jgi:N-methylhydantoinase A/oxoprolinase/acetone carboxylase beta subunit
VVDAQMEQALRAVSVERGVDPAGLALVAFGGAGPLHACDLATALGIPAVVVPPAAGALSAVGLLTSPPRRELVRSWPVPTDHAGLEAALAQLADRALAQLGDDVDPAGAVVTTFVDCRYRGQSHEVTVGSVDEFPAEHWRRNGFRRDGEVVEVVALRAVATGAAPADVAEVLGRAAPFPGRVVGPDVVVRDDCTVWVPAGWVGAPGPLGSLVLRPSEPGAES